MTYLYFKDKKGEFRVIGSEDAMGFVSHPRAAKALIEKETGIAVGDGAILTMFKGKKRTPRGGGGGGGGTPSGATPISNAA